MRILYRKVGACQVQLLCMYYLNSNVLLFSDYVINGMVLFKTSVFLFEHPVMDYSHMKIYVLRTVFIVCR